MPDARIEPEATFRLGVSATDPYFAIWGSVSLFPRLEVSGRYTTINGVPGFADAPGLGDYRDKAFDAKLIVLTETGWRPAVAVGAQDYFGTQLFAAEYVALSKRAGAFDLTLGYGRDRIDGAFGGVRYTPSPASPWRFTVEYDANDYARDFRADLSGADRRTGGATYAVGYRSAWWGMQLGYQRGDVTGNVYVAVPLSAREFVPKIDEPLPYTAITPRAPGREWQADRRYIYALAHALEQQGFTHVHVRLRDPVLELALGHDRIALASRAVGRAARTALRLGPSDMRALRLTFSEQDQPLITYTFSDLDVLERFFAGTASREQLEARTEVTYASAELARALRHARVLWLDQAAGEADELRAMTSDAFVASRARPVRLAGFVLLPFNVRIFFNDPGQPVRYDAFSVFAYQRRLAAGWFATGAARLTLFENVREIRQDSTSLLPHVRSDIAEYRRAGDRLRLNTLLLNRYGMPRRRVYTRWSLGYYEEMYAGGGAQVLYLPQRGDWALDVAADALRQRAPGDAFGFRDYRVITGIASLHYRFPRSGVTTTARLGRFLARDEGVRLEFKRRFPAGVELGAWYSWTNEKDITPPGSPDNPYRDKGLFVSIPLNSMLTRDTRSRASLALADWTRDVAQMVASPGDLYRLIERPLMLDSAAHGAFTEFDR